MKRKSPEERAQIVQTYLSNLKHTWLCMYSEWNQRKLLAELAKAIKRELKDAKTE